MREIDLDGLMMCRIQGRIFEKSLEYLNCSSPVFIKKYMNSISAKSMDNEYFLNTTKSDIQVLNELNTGNDYGQTKYDKDTLYWMGYLYRYWSYIYNIDSKNIYKLFPGTKLEKLYYVYHSFDVEYAIKRIIDSNNLIMEEDSFTKAQNLISERITT